MALNSKQQRFVAEYLVDQNATAAAKRAKYSAKSAHAIGPKLLANVGVAAEIKKGLEAQQREIEKRAAKKGLTKERWLQELQVIGFANMDDFIEIKEVERRTYNGKKGKTYVHVEIGAVPTLSIDRKKGLGRAIKKISETKNGIGIELHSKTTALQDIGKHFGWLSSDMALKLPEDGVQVIVTVPSNGREATSDGEDESGNGS